MLILASVTINTLFGDNGILTQAQDSKTQSKIAEVEESANLIYNAKLIENEGGNEISLEYVTSQLQEEGYSINSVVNDGSAITGITLSDSSVSISKDGGTAEITVSYSGNSDAMQYYAVVEGKNYLITKEDGKISIAKTATEISSSSNPVTLTATSDNTSSVAVGTISGNTITLNSGGNVGSSTITVSYGTYTATCVASVVVKPTTDSAENASTTFSTAYGTIDIIWLDTNNNVISQPNSPANYITSGGNSLKPVVFNSSTSAWDTVEATSDDWYDYSIQKWANAMTANDSYFVWIPRFAYRITYYIGYTKDSNGNYVPSGSPTGYYDGYGMWKAEDGTVRSKLDEGIKTVNYDGNKYIVHPAFTNDSDTIYKKDEDGNDTTEVAKGEYDLGGWDSELAGFWFAKFEISGTGTSIKSIYGIQSTRKQDIGTQYTSGIQATYGYTVTTNADGNTSFMYSHMMKNSEWGAVAYLTQSKYGRNGTIITKNTSAYYCGGGSGTAYINNTNQSTTGNVYGVYDMSGGADERVAAFNSEDSNNYFSTYGWSTATGLAVTSNSTKYATKYTNTSTSDSGNSIVYTYGKVGDATKEVNKGGAYSKTSTTYYCNWFSVGSYFVRSDIPFFDRGGVYMNGLSAVAGLFCSCCTSGGKSSGDSFRVVLCP